MCHIYITHFKQPEKMKHTFEHNAGLTLLSQALSDIYKIQIPSDELDDHMDKNEYGKPFLKDYPDIHFNISHGTDIAVCAISSQNIGIDVEDIKEFNPLILRKVFTNREKEFFEKMAIDEAAGQEWFFRIWTLKEARIKHAGMGLSMSLTGFSFDFDLTSEPYKTTCSDKGIYVQQQILEDRYVLSICSNDPDLKFHMKTI